MKNRKGAAAEVSMMQLSSGGTTKANTINAWTAGIVRSVRCTTINIESLRDAPGETAR